MNRLFREFAIVVATAMFVGAVSAQEPPKADSVEAPKPELKVFPLKHVNARDASRIVTDMMGVKPGAKGLHVVADMAANSVLVYGTAADLNVVRDIVSKIDVPKPEDNEKLSVFHLRSLEPDKALEDALRLAIGDRVFSLDARRKTVIVSADRKVSERVESLLALMEEQASRPSANVQVRVVWLLNGGDNKLGSALPADLKGLLPDLAKIGIDQPRLAAQTLVNVTPGAQFLTEGRAALFGDSRFSVNGCYTDKKEAPSLTLNVRAARRGPGPDELHDLGRVTTDIVAPLGHLVVFGVTPTDDLTSVFVVQVVRPIAAGR